jgi:Phage integrase, N-terminal SAM-like domain
MPKRELSGDEEPRPEGRPRRSKRGNGEGSIYLRQDGRWTAVYFVPKPRGGESRRYVYGRSPEEVETKLVEIRKQVQSGGPVTPAGLTVGAYLAEWVDQVAAPRVRPNTARSYRDAITKYLIPTLGKKRLGSSQRETFDNSWPGCRPTEWVSGRRSLATPSCGPPWKTPCVRRSSPATSPSLFALLGQRGGNASRSPWSRCGSCSKLRATTACTGSSSCSRCLGFEGPGGPRRGRGRRPVAGRAGRAGPAAARECRAGDGA